MAKMKKADEQLSSDFSSSQEKIQKLLKEWASTKVSKNRPRFCANDIPDMHTLTDSESTESDDDEGFLDGDPSNDQDGGNLENIPVNEEDPMGKRMTKIEKQNQRMMKLLSQPPRAPSPTVIEHRGGYIASSFVEKVSKVSLPKKLNLSILTAVYDESTNPTQHVAQYKQRM